MPVKGAPSNAVDEGLSTDAALTITKFAVRSTMSWIHCSSISCGSSRGELDSLILQDSRRLQRWAVQEIDRTLIGLARDRFQERVKLVVAKERRAGSSSACRKPDWVIRPATYAVRCIYVELTDATYAVGRLQVHESLLNKKNAGICT